MECKLSEAQSSLLTRTLSRMKSLHQKPSAYILSIILRANDIPPEDLGQVKEWLAAHQEIEPEPEDPRGKQFTTKSETAVSDPGVDEKEMKGAEKDMTTPNGNGQRTWLDDTEDMLDGNFVKFDDGDEKVLKVVRNPIAGPIEFTQPDGTKKSNEGLNIEVLVDENPKIKTWSVTSKSLMQQIKAICLKERLGPELAGSTLRVTASGVGMQRKYFVKLLARPQTSQAQPRPDPIPVSEAARQAAAQPAPQAVPGAEWIESQKAGMAAPGAR